ncbi:MAG: hypothetical protein U1E91_02180 [Moraxella sp.]
MLSLAGVFWHYFGAPFSIGAATYRCHVLPGNKQCLTMIASFALKRALYEQDAEMRIFANRGIECIGASSDKL